jgi:hypothetical protein
MIRRGCFRKASRGGSRFLNREESILLPVVGSWLLSGILIFLPYVGRARVTSYY